MSKTVIRNVTENVLEIEYTRQPFEAKPRFKEGDGYYLPPAFFPKSLGKNLHRNAVKSGFPYDQFSHSKGNIVTKKREFLILENDRFEVKIGLFWGGRITSFYDKKRKRELLWTPPVLRNSIIGLNGAWMIGGIEWNASRVGHCAHGVYNFGYEIVHLPDGRMGVSYGATDELFESSWKVTLYLDEHNLHCRIRKENHSDRVQPLYWWSNIAVPAGRDVRIMYQPNSILNHDMFYYQCYEELKWPEMWGVDCSDWMNQHENISAYFHQYSSSYMGYLQKNEKWGFYHRADPSRVKGRKLWSLGSNHIHSVWWSRVAEPGLRPYVEIQSGLNPVQIDCTEFQPREVIEWTESMGSIDIESVSDYQNDFRKFEEIARSDCFLSEQVDSPHFWKPISSEVMRNPDDRLIASEHIVRGKPMADESVREIITSGWVGGESWIKLLKERAQNAPPNEMELVACACAMIDLGEKKKAQESLLLLVDNLGKVGALANYLVAILKVDEKDWDAAWIYFDNAIRKDPGFHFIFNACDAMIDESGLFEKRTELWAKAPTNQRDSDEYCVAQAKIHFHRRIWTETRKALSRPLFTIGEGGFNPWRIYKESYLAEALEAFDFGKAAQAQELLSRASEEAPQFMLGREEAFLSCDLFYYRWKLASLSKEISLARSISSHAMQMWPHAHSPEALYLYRLALESGDPSTEQRGHAIISWNDKTVIHGFDLYPIREAVWQTIQGHKMTWERLASDPIYCFRANWELNLT